MRSLRVHSVLGSFFLLTLVVSSPIHAQTPNLSEQDRQAILSFPLTLQRANDLIAALSEMTVYVASRPDVADVVARSMKMTRTELIAQMERDPKAVAIAMKHGLSARDYNYGVPALRMALLAAQGLTGPNVISSPANVAFAKANFGELKPKMDAADGATRRR